tara:strand:- start:13743 stop:14675 length:933 start_codon:yes stop_codon:yes gene_type:complete
MPTKAELLNNKLTQNKRGQNRLKFPLDLDTQGNQSIIRILINVPSGSRYLGSEGQQKVTDAEGNDVTSNFRSEQNKSGISKRFSENYKRINTFIDLFMPPEITSQYQSDWSTEELGSLGSSVDAIGGLSSVNSWKDASNSWQAVKNTLSESGLRTLSTAASALTPLNFEALRKSYTSTVANPYMEVVFNGVENRTFSFTFKMIPRSADEQDEIKRIVDTLKFHRAPEVKFEENTNYWIFPAEFDLQFLHKSKENPWLFKISTCAMTNLTVNHSPDGQYSNFKDGSPSATELTLEFTEMEVLTKNRIEQGY